SREDVELVSYQSRRSITEAHFDLPLLRQLFGPRRRGGEAHHLVVAVGAAPLRPVRRGSAGGPEQQHTAHPHSPGSIRIAHGSSCWIEVVPTVASTPYATSTQRISSR